MSPVDSLPNFMMAMQACALEYETKGTISETLLAFELSHLDIMNMRDFACFGPIKPKGKYQELHIELITAFDRQLGISNVVIKVNFLGFDPLEGLE